MSSEKWESLKNGASIVLEVGSTVLQRMQQAIIDMTPSTSEAVVELQRDLGMLQERCRLQEMINSLNEEFIQLVQRGNSQKNPETKLIEVKLQQYQEELDNLNPDDYQDCSSSDLNDLQGALDAQCMRLKDLLEIANDQSHCYSHLVDNSEKVIYQNQLTIGMFKPEKLVDEISEETFSQTRNKM